MYTTAQHPISIDMVQDPSQGVVLFVVNSLLTSTKAIKMNPMGIPRGQVILGSVKLAALVTTPQTQDCQQHLLLPKTLKDYSKP